MTASTTVIWSLPPYTVHQGLAPLATAVFTANDNLAIGVMFAAQRAGVAVPDRLSIVGYTDTPIAARLSVPLTSVKVPFADLASDALDLLLKEGRDGQGEPRLSAPSLVVREGRSMRFQDMGRLAAGVADYGSVAVV